MAENEQYPDAVPRNAQGEYATEAETMMAPGQGIPARPPQRVTPPPADLAHQQGPTSGPQTSNPWAPAATGELPTFDSQSYSRPILPGVVVDSVSAVPAPVFEEPEPLQHVVDSASSSNIVDRDDLDRTVMSSRKTPTWILETSADQIVTISSPSAILGRKPTPSSYSPSSQLVVLEEPGKTVSKLHARIDFVRGQWIVTDLNSSNGVITIDSEGNETELRSGASAPFSQKILLGDLSLAIRAAG